MTRIHDSKPVYSKLVTLRLALLLVLAMASIDGLRAQVTQVIVPKLGTTPPLTLVTINAGPGDQGDPHISSDWVSYTSDSSIRYYNFSTGIDAQVPMGASARDLLAGVSGSKIVFSRQIPGVGLKIMVFDAATPALAPIEIDPADGTTRFGAAIGGNTVAYVDYGPDPNGEIVAHDLTTSISTRLTNDHAFDQNPNVSPDGSVITWEHCLTSMDDCDIWQAVKTGSAWTVSAVTASSTPEGNPDTNGSLLVYDSLRAGNSGIFWTPVIGGAEAQLELSGYQSVNPSIAGNFISFESRSITAATSDIFVYDISRNLLYQLTNTPSVNEQLNNMTLLPDGRLRVVWASDEDGPFSRNIHAATFTLPSAPPSPADLIQQLVDTVATFNLRNGIVNSLDAKLANAQAALLSVKQGDFSNACGMLGAFISEVQAQTGKAITLAQANQLIDLANQARAGLGCS